VAAGGLAESARRHERGAEVGNAGAASWVQATEIDLRDATWDPNPVFPEQCRKQSPGPGPIHVQPQGANGLATTFFLAIGCDVTYLTKIARIQRYWTPK
jgi:hypothetical protein